MLEQYLRINQVTGVNIHIKQDGTLHINAVIITAKGDLLDIDKKIIDLHSISEIKKSIKAETPIALNISGKGILYKQTEKIEAIDHASFNKILPNAKIDDFYIQNFISGNISFVAVIRKAEADKWTDQFKTIGLIPLTLSFGPFPVINIIQQLNIYDRDIVFNGHLIQRNEQSNWIGYQHDESAVCAFPLKIESETISEKLLIPYAIAFQLVLESKINAVLANVPDLQSALKNRLENIRFKVGGVSILSVLFFLLLVNFILFSWLNSDNSKLTIEASSFAQNTSNIADINKQVKDKEDLLKNLGWDNGINKAGLIDQISALLPEDITLQQIALNPVDMNSSRNAKSLIFFNRQIRITGTSEKIIPVNEWIARIKTKAWVKTIQLDSYAFSTELKTGQFTILLNY